MGESIAGRVIQEGRPIAVPDISVDPRRIWSGFARQEGLVSLLSVPLSLKDKVIGVLNIYTDIPHNFTPHEINLFTSLASQAAIAIENARLFESLEEIYLDVITALASAIDARDPYTHGHSHRVTEYAVLIAEEMGMSPQEVDITATPASCTTSVKSASRRRSSRNPASSPKPRPWRCSTTPLSVPASSSR